MGSRRRRRRGAPALRRAGAAALIAICLAAAGCGGGADERPAPDVPPIPEVTPAPAPPGAAAIPRAGDPGMRFGYNDALVAGSKLIGLLPGSGSDTIRLRLSWNRIQQTPGPFDWTYYDGLYHQLLRQGIRPMWVIVEAPCWSAAQPSECDPTRSAGAPSPEHAGDLGVFAAAVAQHYPESLGMEIGNEVNDARFWPGGQDPVAYAELLRTTSAAVDRVSGMSVVASGLSPIEEASAGQVPWREFLDATIAAGGFDGVDAVGFHPYAQLEPDDDPGVSTGALVDEARAFLDERGQGELPLWITEAGLSTAGSRLSLTDAEQAAGLVQIYEEMEARGIPVLHVHRLVDDRVPGFPLEVGFGVAEEDGRALKPAYCALAELRGVTCP